MSAPGSQGHAPATLCVCKPAYRGAGVKCPICGGFAAAIVKYAASAAAPSKKESEQAQSKSSAASASATAAGASAARTNATGKRRLGKAPGKDYHYWLPTVVNADQDKTALGSTLLVDYIMFDGLVHTTHVAAATQIIDAGHINAAPLKDYSSLSNVNVVWVAPDVQANPSFGAVVFNLTVDVLAIPNVRYYFVEMIDYRVSQAASRILVTTTEHKELADREFNPAFRGGPWYRANGINYALKKTTAYDEKSSREHTLEFIVERNIVLSTSFNRFSFTDHTDMDWCKKYGKSCPERSVTPKNAAAAILTHILPRATLRAETGEAKAARLFWLGALCETVSTVADMELSAGTLNAMLPMFGQLAPNRAAFLVYHYKQKLVGNNGQLPDLLSANQGAVDLMALVGRADAAVAKESEDEVQASQSVVQAVCGARSYDQGQTAFATLLRQQLILSVKQVHDILRAFQSNNQLHITLKNREEFVLRYRNQIMNFGLVMDDIQIKLRGLA